MATLRFPRAAIIAYVHIPIPNLHRYNEGSLRVPCLYMPRIPICQKIFYIWIKNITCNVGNIWIFLFKYIYLHIHIKKIIFGFSN